ncbi:MAG: hypothetical protein PHQ80_00370 [Candidatus ainarchaeum sp.]|nr:hypothetical protein [Candidatus ainarchaeum sp.]MDD5096341.1 hypothetical protein [Candidatus ainarchaeum sp.]
MLPHEESLGKSLEGKSWAEIAALARSLQIKLEREDDEAKNLEARLRVIKQSLIEHMEHPGMDSRTQGLYTSLSALMDSMEEELMKHDIERHEFVEFLRALLSKLKTDKMKSGIPRKAAFTRHKK